LTPSLSIVIPAYNEEGRLGATLDRVHSYLQSGAWSFVEILVVDDGSSDRTVAVAESFSTKIANLRVLRNPGNRGKGYSVRHGMLEARGEWTLFSDADLSSPIEELEKLWAAVDSAQAKVAIGSRALDRSLVGVHQSALRESAGRLFNFGVRAISGLPFMDTQCGFKLFETAAARQIFALQQLERFGFDVEVLFIAQSLGYRTVEVPVRWNDVAGTKVGTLSGLAAFLDPLRVRIYGWQGKYR
jgi:glycosyltransferase involved in cell wall biosynthesis